MRIMFAAGGTGGHINPAVSVAQEVRNRFPDAAILFVGTADKMEAELVPKAGFDFATIDISGFQRSFAPEDIVYNIKTLKKLLFVTGQCKKIIEEFRPDVVVGFGGYVSGPVVRTAHNMGIKTAIHEQNAFPGKTNIALSKYADRVMLTNEDAQKYLKCGEYTVTGLPVRDEILRADKALAREKLGFPEDKKIVLSTGGSLGAKALNDVMCEVIPEFAGKDKGKDIIFIHGYGQNGKDVPEILEKKGIDIKNNPSLIVSEYIYNMADYMAAADLVISRAGASSIAEIQALGKASFLIPYPYAAENHQYYNALSLVNNNAAYLVEQKDLKPEDVISVIKELENTPSKFDVMGRNARSMAITDAKKKICDIVTSLAKS